MDDVRSHLHQAAEAHQPDREAMLARIEQGMARRPDGDRTRLYRRRRHASWLKATLAAVAAVGVLSLGGLAVAAGVRHQEPQHPAPVPVTPTSTAANTAPQPRASADPAPTSTGTTATGHSAAPTADGSISAHGDVDPHSTVYWSQNDLTVGVAQPLTAMTVELRIAQTGGVRSTGDWQTAPADDFAISVTQADGFVVYRWTLKPGRTVPAARQAFAAQFNHDTGKRDAGKDTFLVQAVAGGRTVVVRGGFLP